MTKYTYQVEASRDWNVLNRSSGKLRYDLEVFIGDGSELEEPLSDLKSFYSLEAVAANISKDFLRRKNDRTACFRIVNAEVDKHGFQLGEDLEGDTDRPSGKYGVELHRPLTGQELDDLGRLVYQELSKKYKKER